MPSRRRPARHPRWRSVIVRRRRCGRRRRRRRRRGRAEPTSWPCAPSPGECATSTPRWPNSTPCCVPWCPRAHRISSLSLRRRARHRRSSRRRRRRQPRAPPQRGHLRSPLRRVAARRVVGQAAPSPAEPRRGPPGQRRPVAHRGHPDGIGPENAALRRAPVQGGAHQDRGDAVSEALRRPGSLLVPGPSKSRLTTLGASIGGGREGLARVLRGRPQPVRLIGIGIGIDGSACPAWPG
jgi:hypothetical protein